MALTDSAKAAKIKAAENKITQLVHSAEVAAERVTRHAEVLAKATATHLASTQAAETIAADLAWAQAELEHRKAAPSVPDPAPVATAEVSAK